MNITQFKEHITSLFEEHLNKYGDDEYGFTHISKEEFHKIRLHDKFDARDD